MTGTVKSYNVERGFGFIMPDTGGGKDIFVCVSVLRRSSLDDLFEGQRVTMKVVDGRKGLEAASVVMVTG